MPEEERAKAWRLSLFGRFELCSPSGDAVKLPTRKTEGLLAMLALSGADGLDRSELAQALWPDHGIESRQANLRQSVLKLRKALGTGSVVSTRDRCRLSTDFQLACDAASAEIGPNAPERAALLPDFMEPWFLERRRYFSTGGAQAKPLDPPPMPLEGFLQLLKWYSVQEPDRALELLRSNRDLALGMRPSDLKLVIDAAEQRIRPRDDYYGWLLYWKGVHTLFIQDIPTARPFLRTAAEFGRDRSDSTLEVEGSYWIGVLNILTGHVERAQQAVRRCKMLTDGSKDRLLTARVQSLDGTIKIHQGRTEDGLQCLEQATSGFENNIFEHAQNDALRALYHATVGQIKEADRLLLFPEHIRDETHHFRIEVVCALTRGIMAIQDHEYGVAEDILDKLIARCVDADSTHIQIYAREAFAVVAWNQRERADAKDQLRASARLRRTMQMAYTGWDHLRLSDLKKKP